MVAIVPNLVDAPELTTLAIILWVVAFVFTSRCMTARRGPICSCLSGYTAALIGFPSVLAPGHGVRYRRLARRRNHHRRRLRGFGAQPDLSKERAVGLRSQVAIRAGRRPHLDRRRTDQGADAGDRDGAAPDRRRYYRALSPRHQPALRHLAAASRHRHHSRLRPQDRRAAAAAHRDRGSAYGAAQHGTASGQARARRFGCPRLGAVGGAERVRARAEELRQDCLAATPAVGERFDLGRSRHRQSHRTPGGTDRLLAGEPRSCRLSRRSVAQAECRDPARWRRRSARSRCTPMRASRCSRRLPRPWRWEFALSSGSSRPGPRAPMPSPSPPSPALCSRRSTIRRRRIRPLTTLLALCIPLVIVYQFFILPAVSGFELLSLSLGLRADPGRHHDGNSGLCRDRSGAGAGFLRRNGPADELHRRSSRQIVNSNSAFVVGALVALVVTRLMRVIGVQTARAG